MNLYIASDLDWPEKGVHVRQDTRFPEQQGTTLTITTKNSTSMAINLRIPYWAQGGSAKINGTPLLAFSSPTSYLSLNRVWRSGDKIELNLPMNLHIDPMPDNATVQAMMYGPLVLTGRFEPVTREQQYADYEQKNSTPTEVTDIVADADVATSWVKSDPNQPLTFQGVGQSQPVTMVPLYQVIHDRYAVYWEVNKKSV